MTTNRIERYLEDQGVTFERIGHPITYTAQETSAAAHVTGKCFAKCVLVRCGKRFALLVLTAAERVDLDALRAVLETEDVALATEQEIAAIYPDAELGAMSPFGNLHGMPVYVSPNMARSADIVFNADSHSDHLHISYEDFERLANPMVVEFTH